MIRLLSPLCFLVSSFFLLACGEEDVAPKVSPEEEAEVPVTAAAVRDCSTCTYTVPANVSTIDGKVLGLKPGAVICFNAATKYTNSLTFKNLVGTAEQPIIITNCGGTATLTVTSRPFNFKVSFSKYFRITGGDTDGSYGIRMSGSTSNGMVICDLSTNFEVDHVEVYNVGFAGIMAKTDPSCDDARNRGNFTMRNVVIRKNYIHHTGGEGMYIGHSFYGGYTLSCGVKLPHLIENIKIHENKVTYAGWDGIQLGCASKGAEVFKNTIENSGTKNKADQNYGILLASGTGGICHSNYIKGGTGTGITAFGLGDNSIYNNLIVNPAKTGIFCDERTDTFGAGYKVMNNTIVNPKEVGIRIYSEKVPMNIVINNIVVNPGQYSTYNESAFIMKLKSVLKINLSNNYTTRNIADVKFVDYTTHNYRLTSASPAVNKGASISIYNIPTDFYGGARLKGIAYDIGASEY